MPGVAAAARLNDDQARREASVLDRVRIRHHRDRIDRVVGQREVDEAEHRIGQRAGADLHAGLRRPSAFDADAAGHFDHAREQAQRAAEPVPLANSSVSWLLIDSDEPSVSAADTIDVGAITSTVCVSVASGRSSDRSVVWSADDDDRRARDREAFERRGQRVLAFLDRREAEVAVAVRQHRRDFLIRGAVDDDLRAAQPDRPALRRDEAFDDAAAGGRLRARHAGREQHRRTRSVRR